MSNRAVLMPIVLALGGGGAYLAYAYEKGLWPFAPTGQTGQTGKIAQISIHASATNVTVGNPVYITGMALDSAGNPVPLQKLYLFVNGSQQGNPATTDNSGGYSFTLTATQPGTYVVDVSDNTSNT